MHFWMRVTLMKSEEMQCRVHEEDGTITTIIIAAICITTTRKPSG